jgi:hypothetical protein
MTLGSTAMTLAFGLLVRLTPVAEIIAVGTKRHSPKIEQLSAPVKASSGETGSSGKVIVYVDSCAERDDTWVYRNDLGIRIACQVNACSRMVPAIRLQALT